MERRDTVINGRKYSILQPPVLVAMPLCTRVAALIGPLIATLGADVKSGGWGKFASAIQATDPAKANELMMDAAVAAKLSYGNDPVFDQVNFERHFGQFRGDVYQALSWCLWETVKDFFPELAALLPKIKAVVMKELQSQMAGQSTGGSGDQSGLGSAPGQT